MVDFDVDDASAYLLLSFMIFFPISLVCCAACYSMRFIGSDLPKFCSIFKGFANILDLYTDIAFTFYLFTTANHAKKLAIAAILFLGLSHIVSNVIGIYYVSTWQKSGNIYISQYGLMVIGINIIGMIIHFLIISS